MSFSAKEGTTAADGAGKHSPYTEALLPTLTSRESRSTGCSGSFVMKFLPRQVASRSHIPMGLHQVQRFF